MTDGAGAKRLLLINGRVHSPSHPEATAMAVSDGVVAWLGGDEVGLEQFPDDEQIDLNGGFVAPAFVDSHVHLTATGLRITGLDLSAATGVDHCLRLLAEYVAAHPGEPVWGHGWDDTTWPRPPHLVRAEARRLLTVGQRAAARRAALDLAASAGIVAVHECAGPDIGGLQDWEELRDTRHGVEVLGYWGEAVGTAAQARVLIEATGARGLAGDLFVDGALGSRTAWLCEPYADATGACGTCYLDVEAITEHLFACTEAGVTAGFHVIGDAAVTAAVAALARTVERFGAPAVARCGHRLEHLEMVSAEQARKLGSWGVIASMQPGFDARWGGENGMYARRLGATRAARLNPLALLASAGVPLAFGSDSPVTAVDPWNWVRAAASHRTAGSAVSVR
ncbi:MAG: amidohydrolase, partial [Mycobacteriaceae bacterium]|nr:amidohydrolase [Mycobacteriaceae bacterium]